jgi:DNA-dependent RNA polymerase auxiliary subunit epsilon
MDTPEMHSERSKRRRTQTTKYNMEFIENEEHLMLQQVSSGCGA